MNKENFLKFVKDVESKWHFAKSVPNWPHFYIVEQELPDQSDFKAARAFVSESGRVGKFFDMDVNYFDADGWGTLARSAPLHGRPIISSTEN